MGKFFPCKIIIIQKTGAQCGHASAMVMKKLYTTHRNLLDAWEESGQAKITVRADTVKEMVS